MPGQRRFTLRKFVSQQNAAAHLERIFDGLQSGRKGFPLVMPKVSMACSGGDDEIVVGKLTAMKPNETPCEIETQHFAEQYLDVLVFRQNLTDGRCDLGWRQPCGRHLVKQRLKRVMVLAVHQGDIGGQARQRFGGLKPTKSTAYYHNPRTRMLSHDLTL